MRRGVFVADYETHFDRVSSAMIAGAVFGGLMIMIPIAIISLIADAPAKAVTVNLGAALRVVMFACILVFPITMLGLVGIGGPIWLCLHLLHLRGWGAMVCAGAFVPFPAFTALLSALSGRSAAAQNGIPSGAERWILEISGWGGAIGLLIWVIAYRPLKLGPHEKTFE